VGELGVRYTGHNRAGLDFDLQGREFVVDDRQVAELGAEVEKQLVDAEKKLASVERSEPVGSGEQVEHAQRIDDLTARLRALRVVGYLDEPGRPLIITKKLYEYLREGARLVVQLK
jgi:hypothetical protein